MLSKSFIKSTCTEIRRKRIRAKKLKDEFIQLSEQADALSGLLHDTGMNPAEIMAMVDEKE